MRKASRDAEISRQLPGRFASLFDMLESILTKSELVVAAERMSPDGLDIQGVRLLSFSAD